MRRKYLIGSYRTKHRLSKGKEVKLRRKVLTKESVEVR